MKLNKIIILIFLIILIKFNGAIEVVENENLNTFVNTNNLTLFTVKSIITPNSESLSDRIQTVLGSLPRYDFHLHKVDREFDPSNSSYIESILVTGSPFALISCLILLSLLFGSVGYAIYRLFIRPRRRFSMNLENFKINEEQQSSWKGYCWTSLTIFFLFSICGLLIIGLFVNMDLDDSVLKAIDSLQSNIQERSMIESRIVDETRKLSIYHRLPYDAYEIIDMTNSLLTWTNTSQKYVHHYEKMRYNFVFTSILVMFAIASLGLMSVMFKSKPIVVLFMALGIIVSGAVWIVPASHVPLGVVVSDVCPQIQTLIQNSVPEEIDPYIDFFLTCNDSSSFDFITDILDNVIDDTENRLNIAIKKNYSKAAIQQLEYRLKELNDLSVDAKNILNCNITSITYLSVQNIVCIEIINSSTLITCIFILVGIFFVITFITLVKFYKSIDTYRPLDDTENFSTEEDDNYVDSNINVHKPLLINYEE